MLSECRPISGEVAVVGRRVAVWPAVPAVRPAAPALLPGPEQPAAGPPVRQVRPGLPAGGVPLRSGAAGVAEPARGVVVVGPAVPALLGGGQQGQDDAGQGGQHEVGHISHQGGKAILRRPQGESCNTYVVQAALVYTMQITVILTMEVRKRTYCTVERKIMK